MIGNVFQKLCSNIEISNDKVLEICKYKDDIVLNIDEYFNSKLAKQYSQFIGSYGRNTAIYTDNIRLMVIIPEEMYWQLSLGIFTILAEMKKALNKKYLSCEYSDNGNGLNISIDDSLSFEIVPGFIFENGEYIYLYSNQWQKLNLKAERENFYKVNTKVNNNLIELCRILKVWKNTHDLDISNILLDTFAYHFFDFECEEKGYYCNHYDEMIVNFFNYLIQNCKKDSFISFDGETVLKRKIDLYDKVFFSLATAQTAIASADCGMFEEAFKDWQKVLGYSGFLNVTL